MEFESLLCSRIIQCDSSEVLVFFMKSIRFSGHSIDGLFIQPEQQTPTGHEFALMAEPFDLPVDPGKHAS